MAEHESAARLIGALKDFKQASDRSSRLLLGATIALIVLTAVVVALTIVLVWLTAKLN